MLLRTLLLFAVAALLLHARTEAQTNSCRVFIDNRGNALRYHVRQIVKIELNAYISTSDLRSMDTDAVFLWSVDRKTAAIVPDLNAPGRAFFYPGRREGTYIVTVEGFRTAAAALSKDRGSAGYCSPSSLKIRVENDFVQFAEMGGAWNTGSPGVTGRLVAEFSEIEPWLVEMQWQRLNPGATTVGQTQAVVGVKLKDQRIYAEAKYLHRTFGSLSVGGLGFNLERLIDVDRQTSLGWSIGTCFCAQRVFSVSLSATYLLPSDRYFVEVGIAKENASGSYAQTTQYLMLGQRL